MSFLKTLAAAFKGGGARVPLARSFASPWSFADDAPFDYAASVKRAYLDNPVAQRAVRLVAEGIGGAPLAAGDPRLSALIRATSAGQPLLETLASQLLLHGNAFVQVMKDARGFPVELFALRPERMRAPTGAWDGEAGRIACRQQGNWLYVSPRDGMRLLDRDSGQERRYHAGWLAPEAPLAPSGGATVDAEARAAIVALIEGLREAGIFPES